jgi:phosphoribosyl 1,2-cyclic phosphodiesterase
LAGVHQQLTDCIYCLCKSLCPISSTPMNRLIPRVSSSIPRYTPRLATPALTRAMHIQSIPMWVGSGNNYAYLVVDDKSKDAVIVDPANPPEVTPVLKEAIDSGRINLKAIVNTHHHGDHSGGNNKLVGTSIKREPPSLIASTR